MKAREFLFIPKNIFFFSRSDLKFQEVDGHSKVLSLSTQLNINTGALSISTTKRNREKSIS